jgi:predicted Zn-dependent protease
MLSGLVALRSHDFASAEKTFQALHVEMPANVAVSNRWAIALAEQDDPQKKSRAWQICEVNQKLDPGSAEVLSTRGQVARRLGRGDDAERALRAAASTGRATSDMFYDLAVVLSERGKLGEVKPLLQAALKTPSGFSRRREALAWLARLDPPAKPASVKSVR